MYSPYYFLAKQGSIEPQRHGGCGDIFILKLLCGLCALVVIFLIFSYKIPSTISTYGPFSPPDNYLLCLTPRIAS
jgi:hypothetical protein